MYISRNPNLCLVARQESSNRDMFSMLKKKLLSLFQYPRVLFFFFGSFYICLAWVVVFFFTPFGFSLYIFKEAGDTACSPGRRRSRDNANTAGKPFSSLRHASHVRCGGWTFFFTREQDEVSQWEQPPERRDEV